MNVPRITPFPADLAGRPFTRTQAEELGLSRRVLQGQRFQRLAYDVYVERTLATDPLVRARAMLLVDDKAVLSHFSAAMDLGLPVPPHSRGHVSIPRGCLRRVVPAVHVHEWRAATWPTSPGARRTSEVRTFCDLARWLDLVDLVALGDAMVRNQPQLLDALRVGVKDMPPMAGVRRARAAVRLIRLNVDSVPETETRLLFVLAGLPEPVANVRVTSSSGDFIALPDLCWLCSRTAVEYDGRHHVIDYRQWRHDLGRRERYDDEGWRVLVAHAADRRNPGQLLRRVHRILLERGEPGVPAELSPEWRLHFPRRPVAPVLPGDRMAA